VSISLVPRSEHIFFPPLESAVARFLCSEGARKQSEGEMKSPVVKRSIVIGGHKTSVSLEDAFWKGLKEIASQRDQTLSELVGSIDAERRHGNLSSGLRLFVLDYYRSKISPTMADRESDLERTAVARSIP
jgi:predicted DNA-binding ribbon-helix-helix protein